MLDFSTDHSNYLLAEMERVNDLCKKNTLAAIVRKNLLEVNKNFICILFGSQAVKYKPNSDIDLLFVIPQEYDFSEFERIIRNALIATNADLTFVPESSLHEMWSNPQKLNVGNELLKRHIILYGAEHFWHLRRKHHVG
jgi:predicted nucleotidyltransferase